MSKLIHRVRSNHGETIGEMLVSSLIIALGIIMLVTMVNIAGRLINKSTQNRKDAFDAENTAEAADNPDTGNDSFTITGKSEAIGGPSLNNSDSQKQGGNADAEH